MFFKPIYMWGWTHEGILYRRGKWAIILPTPKRPGIWKLRKVGSGTGAPKDLGEADFHNAKEAFKAGSRLLKGK